MPSLQEKLDALVGTRVLAEIARADDGDGFRLVLTEPDTGAAVATVKVPTLLLNMLAKFQYLIRG